MDDPATISPMRMNPVLVDESDPVVLPEAYKRLYEYLVTPVSPLNWIAPADRYAERSLRKLNLRHRSVKVAGMAVKLIDAVAVPTVTVEMSVKVVAIMPL